MLSFYQRKNLYEPQMSVAPNMTSAKTGQAVYGGSQPQTSWTSKYTTTPTIVPSWTQSAPVKPTTQTRPQMSVAPRTIQGSGMTSQFASNPTNYKPRQVAPPPPRVPPPTNQVAKQSTPADTYLQKLASLNAQRTNQINQGTDSYEQKVTALDERQRQRNLDRIPQLQEGYNKYVQNVRDTIKGEEAATAESEAYTKEQYGSAQRKSARDKRLQDANLMNMFAGLGTLDSSAFQDIQTNRTNDFVMKNQSIQQEQAREVAGLRRGLDDFRRQAEQGIMDEESNLQARIAEIQNTVDQNSFQYDQLISQAIQEAQGKIGAIEDAYLGQEYAVRQKEYELTQAGTEKLSQMFLQTGQPQNQSDYEWMINNPDKYKEAFQMGQANTAEKQDLVSLVDRALDSDLGAYAGLGGRTGVTTYAGQGLVTKSMIDQIKNKLTVEAREKLKGSGQISDKETEMLANSVSKLQPGMPLEALKIELQEIKNVLEGKSRYEQTTQGSDPLGIL